MTNAYPQSYLADAKSHLGACTDYLINRCGIATDRIGYLFSVSPIMKSFQAGDPGVVGGLSGAELGARIYEGLYAGETAPAPAPLQDGRTAEYWGGWALAHFQWYWDKSFKWIFARTTMSALLAKYSVYHEMDIARFLEDFKMELDSIEVEPNLRRIRRACGYSQAELAKISGINIRNIQLYEQRVQDINRASAASLRELAKSLACSIEDLME